MDFKIEGRITYLRKLNKLTQNDLSKLIHLTQPNIARYEKGVPLPQNIRQALSEVFGVSESYFMATKPDPKVDALLEDTFCKLLNINIESLSEVFEREPYDLEISQELAFRLLHIVYYYKNNQFKQGDKLYDDFIALFIDNEQQLEDHATLLKCYHLYKYELNFKDNNLEECYNYCKLLTGIVTNDHQKGRCLVLMSQTLSKRGFMNEALLSINKAIAFIETFDKGMLLAGAYVNHSSILVNFKLYNEALETLQKLENINKVTANQDASAVLFQHRGAIFLRTKEYQKAVENYELAHSNAKYPHIQIKILISLISCHLKMKNIAEAKKHLEIMQNQELRQHEMMIMKSLECEIYLHNNEIDKHKKLLKNVLNYFEANNLTSDLKHIYSYLAKYHYEQQSYKEAATYLIKKEQLNND